MKSSTGLPAMTSSIMRRGFLSLAQNSLMEWAPTMDLPLASVLDERGGGGPIGGGRLTVLEEAVDLGNGTVEGDNGESVVSTVPC
jgi:hypothetical protein